MIFTTMIIVSKRIEASVKRSGMFDCWYHSSVENELNWIRGGLSLNAIRAMNVIVTVIRRGSFLLLVREGALGVSATKYENITNIPPT